MLRSIIQNIIFIVPVLLACIPFVASAHVTGASWEVPAGSYTADVGYDTTTFVAGNSSRFDFNLKTAPGTTSTPVNFAQVWVRITEPSGTDLATGILHQPIGPTTLLYSFANSGEYTLWASFRDPDGNEIAAASFPIAVSPSPSGGMLQGAALYIVLVVGGVVLGVVLAMSLPSVIRKLRKS